MGQAESVALSLLHQGNEGGELLRSNQLPNGYRSDLMRASPCLWAEN